MITIMKPEGYEMLAIFLFVILSFCVSYQDFTNGPSCGSVFKTFGRTNSWLKFWAGLQKSLSLFLWAELKLLKLSERYAHCFCTVWQVTTILVSRICLKLSNLVGFSSELCQYSWGVELVLEQVSMLGKS